MTFKLTQYFEIKEIQIGLINFWSTNTETYVLPSSIIIEAGLTQEDMQEVCCLEKIDDPGFGNFSCTVYGKNFYTYQNSITSIENAIKDSFWSMINVRAKYIKFKMRNNIQTSLENSPLVPKVSKPWAIGVNYISIMGYNVNNIGNLKNTILDS